MEPYEGYQIEECKGCSFYEECWFWDADKCPCLKCLVKPACSKACEAMKKFETEQFKKQGGTYMPNDQFGWN